MASVTDHFVDLTDNPAPPGTESHVVYAIDNVGLRLFVWRPSTSAGGTVCIMTGRSEYVEKYFETVQNLLDRGFAVVAFDWRGQGGSERALRNRLKGHIDHFTQYRRDFEASLGFMRENALPRPWYGLAHSMGGAVVIDALAHGESRLDRAVACAPMVGLHGIPSNGWEANAVRILNFIGLGSMFLPDSRSHAPSAFDPFKDNMLTSDAERYERAAAILIAAPDLAVGGPTVGWTAASFRLMRSMTSPDYGIHTKTPILLINAGDDRIVSPGAAEALAARTRLASSITITGARHEILMERDVFRNQFMAAFDAFCQPRLAVD